MQAKPKKTLLTVGLIYANGPVHLGHMLGFIIGDVYSRFLRLIGEEAIFCSGEDTHGTPIELDALKQGIRPEELISRYDAEHKSDFKRFGISFDSYYTTHSKENENLTQLFFEHMKKRGYIYKKAIKCMYCKTCKRFLPDRFIKGTCPECGADEQYGDQCEKCGATYEPSKLLNPKCVLCGSEPIARATEHYFFKLSAFQDRLKEWIEKSKTQPVIKNYVLGWIKQGLKDWCISRDGPYFGFTIPGEKDKFFYVWFDAPIGYISSSLRYAKRYGLDVFKDMWASPDCRIIHIIGKDIVYFHFLFWPAMLLAMDLRLPDRILVHGHITINKEKMSKSKGTFFTAADFASSFNPEYLRYYYASNFSDKVCDIDFSFEELARKINNELIANLGNFCYRVLSFINKHHGSEICGIADEPGLLGTIAKMFETIKRAYESFNFKEAVALIMEIASLGNKYFQESEPWKDAEKSKPVLGLCANIIKNLGILINPILPEFSSSIFKQLSLGELKWQDLGFDLMRHRIGKAKPLFKKIGK